MDVAYVALHASCWLAAGRSLVLDMVKLGAYLIESWAVIASQDTILRFECPRDRGQG